MQQYFLSQKAETISYSQFKQDLAQGSVEKVTIGPDNITGNFKGKDNKPGEQFVTVRVDDPGLVKSWTITRSITRDATRANFWGVSSRGSSPSRL